MYVTLRPEPDPAAWIARNIIQTCSCAYLCYCMLFLLRYYHAYCSDLRVLFLLCFALDIKTVVFWRDAVRGARWGPYPELLRDT